MSSTSSCEESEKDEMGIPSSSSSSSSASSSPSAGKEPPAKPPGQAPKRPPPLPPRAGTVPSQPGTAPPPSRPRAAPAKALRSSGDGAKGGRSARLASSAPSQRKRRKLRAKDGAKPGSDGENEDFSLNLEALQGRWRHSSPALGMFVVKGKAVKFDAGTAYSIVEGADGSLSMLGWTPVCERSSAETIVWTKDGAVCSWHLEDDGDLPEHGVEDEVNEKNIIQGKRRRREVDYKALDRQLPQEDFFSAPRKRGKDWRSDEDEESDDNGAEEAEERMSTKEWSESHAKKVAQAMKLFEKWLLSTRTPQHEERLRRRGSLATTLPVKFTGVGQQMIEKELRFFDVQVAHREAGTVVSITTAGRSRFKERNAELWQTEPLPTPRLAAPKAAPSVVPAPAAAGEAPLEREASSQAAHTAAPAAPVPAGVAGMEAAREPRRRRLRRAVVDSEESDGGGAVDKSGAAATAIGTRVGDDAGTAVAASEAPPAVAAVSPTAASEVPPAVAAVSPTAASEVPLATSPDVQAHLAAPAVAAPEVKAVGESTPSGPARSVEEVQELLKAKPPAEEAVALLAYLADLQVDSAVLERTKVGMTVNQLRKLYAQDAKVVAAAKDLVERWRRLWQLQRQRDAVQA